MKELEEKNKELIKKDKGKSDHFASVIHDLRNPLTCLIACIDLLSNVNATQEEREENIQIMKLCSEMILSLISNEILNI